MARETQVSSNAGVWALCGHMFWSFNSFITRDFYNLYLSCQLAPHTQNIKMETIMLLPKYPFPSHSPPKGINVHPHLALYVHAYFYSFLLVGLLPALIQAVTGLFPPSHLSHCPFAHAHSLPSQVSLAPST